MKTVEVKNPTSGGWSPQNLLVSVLEMRMAAINDYRYGPYVLYLGNSWGPYLMTEYNPPGTIRRNLLERLRGVSGVIAVVCNDEGPANSYAVVLSCVVPVAEGKI